MPFGWRPDGRLVQDIPATRRIMPYIMNRRNESIVFFEQEIKVDKLQAFIEKHRAESGLHTTLLHVLIWAVGQVLSKRPRLNRFTAGHRIYQRDGIWASFSAKKQKSDDAPIVVIKRQINPDLSLGELIQELDSSLKEGRSDKKSTTDKELALLFLLPSFMIAGISKLLFLLDSWGLMPGAMIRSDPMFASVFIANLGSLGMDAGFHHLYEYGNIPIFITVGQIKEQWRRNDDGEGQWQSTLTLRYSFDERIEDGLYCLQSLELLKTLIEDPELALQP